MKQARMTVSHIITRQREETAKRINAQVLPQLSSLLEGNPPTISRDISHIGGLPVREHPLATLARLNVPQVSDPPPVSEHPFVASARRGSVGLSGPSPSPVPLGSTRRGSMSLSIPAPTQAAEHPGVVSARRSSISLNKPVPTPVAEHPLVASARRAASISLGIGEASAYSFFGIGGSALDLGLGDNRSFTGDRNKSATGGRIDTREISGMGEESSSWLSDYGWLSSSTNSPRRSAQSELCYRPPGDYRWVDENAIASSDGDSEGKRCIRKVLLYGRFLADT